MHAVFPIVTEEESKLPFYIKSVGICENQDSIHRPSGYTDYHWLHCLKGKGKLILGGNEWIISENMGFFFYPDIPHEYYPIDEPWETHWVTFSGYASPSFLNLIGLNKWGVFNLSSMQNIEKSFTDIYKTAQSEGSLKGFECSAFLYKFLVELKNCISEGDTSIKTARQRQLQVLISYIEKNYSRNFSLEEMADIIKVTPQHLCRLFKQAFNMRPFVYLTMLRIQKAKEIIISSENATIKDIAQQVGYNDSSYFCSLFKEYEGLTPMEFKKMHRSV